MLLKMVNNIIISRGISNKYTSIYCLNICHLTFTGDIATAKEILLKMKYYDNINEQIKEKLLE